MVGCVLLIAAFCDLLSIVDAGWVVSWTIPIISWFMVRRINSIMKSSELIAKATNRLAREAALARQRVMQILPPTERGRVAASERVSAVSEQAKSYVRTWIRDSVITQLIELVPVVDILPLYLGQVVKMIINQNIEYQKVKKLMPAYESILARTDALERMEIEQLERLVLTLLGDRTGTQPRTPEPSADRVPAQPRPRNTPGPERAVRDIRPAVALPVAA